MTEIGHNSIAANIRDRAIKLEAEKRERAEDIKHLYQEASSKGLDAVQIDGIKVSVRRHFAKAEKLEKQQAALQFALSFE